MENWKVKMDMQTLMEADKIRNDSKRFAAAKKMATSEQANVNRVFGNSGKSTIRKKK